MKSKDLFTIFNWGVLILAFTASLIDPAHQWTYFPADWGFAVGLLAGAWLGTRDR